MRNLGVFIGRRLLITVPMLLIVSILTFVILRMLPSDPVAMIVGINRTPERVEFVTAQLGLDKPLVEQFVIWMGNVLQGDLGTAWHTGQAVTTDLAARIPASVELAFLALLIGVPGGVATGVIAARYRDRFADFGLRFSSLLAIATPEFLFGIFAIWLFFAVLNWAPAPLGRIEFGISPPEAITGLYIVDSVLTRNTEALVSSLRSIALPAISLGVILAGGFQRFTRATMVESLSSDAVLSSRGHGLPNRLVFYKYSLKQALLVVVPVFGIVVAYAIGGLVAVERIFSWPGVGRYALEAVSRADLNAVQGFILFSVVLYVALNLFVDIVQAIIDPRIEYR
ncbi:MAG: ABC transporter permease [bacterium]|nr:ABC transporter permease [bacterium]MDE0289482.1 ABC transporter permease [bacterium]MDE0439880.1 ABC transporter permease [bacterium]